MLKWFFLKTLDKMLPHKAAIRARGKRDADSALGKREQSDAMEAPVGSAVPARRTVHLCSYRLESGSIVLTCPDHAHIRTVPDEIRPVNRIEA